MSTNKRVHIVSGNIDESGGHQELINVVVFSRYDTEMFDRSVDTRFKYRGVYRKRSVSIDFFEYCSLRRARSTDRVNDGVTSPVFRPKRF